MRPTLARRLEADGPAEDFAALDPARLTELLLVARRIGAHADRAGAGGAAAHGVLPCPRCATGAIAYHLTPRGPGRRQIRAVCNTAGCVRFYT